ncbi:aldose 1-epimerase [Streptomyces durbertensis]|uniref:Aldose 1-epimerase n=1 Tax=Streptomyces durbertensis TaxID=2448886 RepID=A0ABR6EGP3_9ACTN|nr:aldose 1-epimerase [Streptomyces durbertensis]MBB1244506.1 aldose 1-epimerase [Streptomyces durbertensis]
MSALSNEEVRLRAQDTEVVVRPGAGCRLASLRVGGVELLRQGAEFGSFVMAPWCGRTAGGRFRSGGGTYQLPVDETGHAMHGLVRDEPWRTARADERSAAFVRELGDPWPWPGTVNQLVELSGDGGSLTLTLGVETFGDSFPAQVGWHPWFRRNLGQGGEDVRLEFDPAWREERDEHHIPTGRRVEPGSGPWDDAFGMPDGVSATLTWPGELELTVASRTEWAVVYDEQEAAVCVEPQSGPPNGLNTHPRLVTPISPLELSTTWSWRRHER